MINLYFSNGKIFVWNAEDSFKLRKEHRIVSSLVGCYPIKPFQVQSKWLPMQLMPEETKLLIEKGLAHLISSPTNINDASLIKSYFTQQDKLCEEQIDLLKEERCKQILEKADEIFEGKKRKYLEELEKKMKKVQKKSEFFDISVEENLPSENPPESNVDKTCDVEDSNSIMECKADVKDTEQSKLEESNVEVDTDSECQKSDAGIENIDKDTIIKAELDKVPTVSKELCMVQLFTECPFRITVVPTNINWKYPSNSSEKLRYAVFKDLWEKGYYITPGSKFGGDFLAYEGDPLKYHALFIVICLEYLEKFQGSDLVVYGRLGHQVKKTVALASLNNQGTVEYLSLSWENEVL